jgi:hypothetical protein
MLDKKKYDARSRTAAILCTHLRAAVDHPAGLARGPRTGCGGLRGPPAPAGGVLTRSGRPWGAPRCGAPAGGGHMPRKGRRGTPRRRRSSGCLCWLSNSSFYIHTGMKARRAARPRRAAPESARRSFSILTGMKARRAAPRRAAPESARRQHTPRRVHKAAPAWGAPCRRCHPWRRRARAARCQRRGAQAVL